MLSLILVCIFVAIAVCFILQEIIPNFRYYKLAWQIPGITPFIPSMISGSILWSWYKFDIYKFIWRYNSETDELRSLWLPKFQVLLKKEEHLKIIFSSPHCLEKSYHYDGLVRMFGSAGLVVAAGDDFRRSKQVFLKSFNSCSQEIILENVARDTDKLVNLFRTKSGKGNFKIAKIMKETVANSIMGSALDTYDRGEIAMPLTEKLDRFLMSALLNATIGKIPLVRAIAGFDEVLKDFVKDANDFFAAIYPQKNRQHSDMIASKINVPNQFIYNVLRERANEPIEAIYSDIFTVIIAALGTTAVTTSITLLLLGMHPDIQEKVYQEDKIVQEQIKYQKFVNNDFSRYEYLPRVIKETLRLYPSVPMIARHVAKDIKLGSVTLPAGSSAAIYIPSIHRDPANYIEPNKFDPERFLPENVSKRSKYVYMPFSFGQRQCPGMKYATESVIYMISSIVRNFKIYSKYKTIDEMDENITGFVTLVDKEEFTIRLEERNL